MYSHPQYHEESETPIPGCPLCDEAVARPVVRRFGAGSSSLVVPRRPPIKKDKDRE